MPGFVDALDTEISELEQELMGNPVYVKLQEARRLRAIYTKEPASPALPQPRVRRRTRTTGASVTILEAVREFLSTKTAPTPTREIMDMLEQRGIELSGAVPQNTVSSILSKTDDVIANGRSGWTLTPPDNAETNSTDDTNPTKEASPVDPDRQEKFLTDLPAQGREAVPGGGP